MAQYCPQMSCVPSTRGECPPRAVLGGHPPCRPRALQHPRGPPRVGWSLGCRGLHSGAAIPHTLSASPGPAFPCTGQPVQGRATQKHGRVSTLKCLNHSNLLRPLALLDPAVRCLPPLCELCGACRLGSKWESTDCKPRGWLGESFTALPSAGLRSTAWLPPQAL